ncbi:hypothetical protein [Lutimonas sp.]|uniref:hypothetical protein n=1 Tax=Lutimonas sp. TaxID=1872403 RepID=UPI003D9B7213
MKFFNRFIWSCIILMGPLYLEAQEEESNPLLTDKFYVEAGVFIPQKDVKFGADGDLGEDIDFGRTFDFNDNQATFFFNGEWRWNKKWRLTGEYFAVNNASRVTLDRDIVLDNITFEEGTFVRGGVEFALFRVFVGRTISTGPKHSLGAGLGVHMVNIGAFLEGEVRTDQGDKEFRAPRTSFLIPLPNLGAWYHWAPTPKWAVSTRLDYFGISIDKYSGGLWNIAPGLKYQIIQNFGVGLDYRFFFLNAKVSDDLWQGEFDMNFSGPLVTLHGNF